MPDIKGNIICGECKAVTPIAEVTLQFECPACGASLRHGWAAVQAPQHAATATPTRHDVAAHDPGDPRRTHHY